MVKAEGTEKIWLQNPAGINLTGNWQLPKASSTPGTIQNKDTNMYLGVNSGNASGSAIVVEDLDEDDAGQKWERSPDDSSGYFTLRNPDSGKFLTALYTENKPPKHIKSINMTIGDLTIEGRSLYDNH